MATQPIHAQTALTAHLLAYGNATTGKQAAHLEAEHGWTVHDGHRIDHMLLEACHFVAHQYDTVEPNHTTDGCMEPYSDAGDLEPIECDRHGWTYVKDAGSGSGYAGGTVYWATLACGCSTVDESDDVRAAR